jgi:hypothetical protein
VTIINGCPSVFPEIKLVMVEENDKLSGVAQPPAVPAASRSAIPPAGAQFMAAVVLLFWACGLLLAALVLTAVFVRDVILIFLRFPPSFGAAEWIVFALMGLLSFTLIKFAILLIKAVFKFFNRQPVKVDSLISATMVFETIAYCLGCMVIFLLCLFGWVVLFYAVPLLALGGALTATRAILRRAKSA